MVVSKVFPDPGNDLEIPCLSLDSLNLETEGLGGCRDKEASKDTFWKKQQLNESNGRIWERKYLLIPIGRVYWR